MFANTTWLMGCLGQPTGISFHRLTALPLHASEKKFVFRCTPCPVRVSEGVSEVVLMYQESALRVRLLFLA
jgi:hypothetical protein